MVELTPHAATKTPPPLLPYPARIALSLAFAFAFHSSEHWHRAWPQSPRWITKGLAEACMAGPAFEKPRGRPPIRVEPRYEATGGWMSSIYRSFSNCHSRNSNYLSLIKDAVYRQQAGGSRCHVEYPVMVAQASPAEVSKSPTKTMLITEFPIAKRKFASTDILRPVLRMALCVPRLQKCPKAVKVYSSRSIIRLSFHCLRG